MARHLAVLYSSPRPGRSKSWLAEVKAHPFKIKAGMTVVDLMDEIEQVYEEASKETLELQAHSRKLA